jgi:hypothetical protein
VDCEKFESLLIDELYGELDEVTSAAVRRHAAGCARCGALLSGLRATRKVAALPMEEPSVDLEDRILSAVREQQKVLPFRARASSVLSRAGAWAMRPQTAMAAVFLLVIGTSFVLVQSRAKQEVAASKNAEGMPVQAAAASPTATAMASGSYALEKESAFAHGVEERRPDIPKAAPSTATDTLALLAGADGDRERDKAKDENKKNLDTNGISNAGPIGGVAMNDLTTTSRSVSGWGGQGQTAQPGGGGGGGGAANMPPPVAVAQQQAQTNTGAQAKAQPCTQADANRFDQQHTSEATLAAARCYRDLGNSNAARARYSSLQSTQYAPIAQQEMNEMAPAAARKAPAHMAAEVQAAPPPRATATAQTTPAQAKPTDQQKGAASY